MKVVIMKNSVTNHELIKICKNNNIDYDELLMYDSLNITRLLPDSIRGELFNLKLHEKDDRFALVELKEKPIIIYRGKNPDEFERINHI